MKSDKKKHNIIFHSSTIVIISYIPLDNLDYYSSYINMAKFS